MASTVVVVDGTKVVKPTPTSVLLARDGVVSVLVGAGLGRALAHGARFRRVRG
jgi:hypothetical protein